MKFALPLQIVLLAAIGIGGSTLALPPQPVQAVQFDKSEIDPSRFLILASPIGTTNAYKLLIFEQLNNRRQCWQEVPGTPTTIDPLFMTFDFTGICGRSTDSNAYSVRVGDEDLAGRYNLRLVRKANELVLVAFSLTDKNLRFFEIGRTHGLSDGYLKIDLDPGWRLTRRMFNGKSTGHLYFTTDLTLGDLANQATPLTPTEQSPTAPTTTPSQSSTPPTGQPSDLAPSGTAPTNLPPSQNPSLPPPPTGEVAPAGSAPSLAPSQNPSLPPPPTREVAPAGSAPAIAPSQSPTTNPAPQSNRHDVVIPVTPGEPLTPPPVQPDTPPQTPATK